MSSRVVRGCAVATAWSSENNLAAGMLKTGAAKFACVEKPGGAMKALEYGAREKCVKSTIPGAAMPDAPVVAQRGKQKLKSQGSRCMLVGVCQAQADNAVGGLGRNWFALAQDLDASGFGEALG